MKTNEEKYLIACYGLIADSPMHTVTKGEYSRKVFTSELDYHLQDGWTLSPKAKPTTTS